MKKQFNRMRQLANQTVGRAEKTEVLSEDLLQIERRLDIVRLVCHNAHKKLLGCLQGQPGTDSDKRYRKLPLMGVSQSMQEGCTQLSDETLLGKTLYSCGEAEQRLAMELSQHEVQIERDILEPLNQLSEVDIPNIQKQRKQLAKLVLDWDSAKGRWMQALKSSSTNFQMQPGKIESLKEEADEAHNRVEQCKDQLAADMYNFVSKEADYGQYFVMLLEAQADYHRKALSVLEKALPEIQAQQDKWTEKPAFGTALEEHLKRSGREIALPIEACVMMLLETGMKEEGLFRIAAGASKLKKLKAALDCSTSQLEEFYSDPHAVAGALKSYLRELPEPLMTFNLYEEWIQAGNIPDQSLKLQALWVVCQKLPKPNLENFKYLVKFLAKLSHSSDINKMTPSNIAIVLGPNLLWAKHEGTLAEIAAATSVHVVTIIEPIIQHADWFFPEDVEFNVSGAFVPATPSTHFNNVSYSGNDVTYEFGPMERKRPISMAVMDGDLFKKESKVIEFYANSRRGGTLTRKHASPAFHPPLPPTDGAIQTDPGPMVDVSATAPTQGAQTTDPTPTQGNEEASTLKTKDPPTATTPPSLRNGAPHPQGGSTSQQGTAPAPGAANPSPHSTRRATKKPAPAPPKPVIPPPVQPGNQGSPAAVNPPPTVSPKPTASTHNPSPPNSTTGQSTAQATPIYSFGSLPRRYSGSQPLIQAPNHPPPQPPTQPVPTPLPKPVAVVTPVETTTEHSPSPPRSPSPPDTPPLGIEQSVSQPALPEATQTQPSPPQTGTLPRPRPVPKPRIRPSIPPPPQPPGSHPAVETHSSASKMITGWENYRF
ncbi:rho GTPase-activating protein 17 isoform X2 [Bombina bombina]|uniref:rho GTPase-activating protein 17 isoform X2 n=1 Tax=Bombina bombina TaxID=8345 RepID=UPI00235A710D|nr:rho GTPase-activating protein 17 isoform X2 [Bombina bombina]